MSPLCVSTRSIERSMHHVSKRKAVLPRINQNDATNDKLITERLSQPSGTFMKYVYKSPIFLYRLGLGSLIGQLFMVMTTIGCQSGLARRTAIELHQHKRRNYVMVGWTKPDWYQNTLHRSPFSYSQAHRQGSYAQDTEFAETMQSVGVPPIIWITDGGGTWRRTPCANPSSPMASKC